MFFLTVIFFLSPKANAQTNTDCHEVFNKESNSCLKESSKCISSCVDKAREAMSLTVDGGKVNLECQRNVCDPASEACSNKATTNFRACLDAGKQSPSSEAKQETPSQDKKGVNIFKIFELFSKAVTNLATNKESSDSRQKETQSPVENLSTEIKFGEQQQSLRQVGDWIMENDLISDPARIERMEREKLDIELYGRTPQMTEEIIKKAQDEWKKTFEPAETKPATPLRARADYLKGDADIKYPGTDEWVPLKTGDIIPPGSTLFTGMDATLVLSLQDKGVFQMLPFTEIVVSEETVKGASHTDIKLNTGDIEVSVEGGVYTGTLQVQTPSVVAGVRGTHFWVSYDKDKRLSVAGVYEGKVEVTSRGSDKSVTISPDGDKPGVVMVTQKLSITKLVITGLVLLVILGGIIWFIKRKTSKKSFKNRSR